ncbi:hypothetical protein [Flavobacterium gelatinilyticum]|uniref:hypothetical protein n=1 Tax=Flavobacterium gelatinilyticum TaxID=3003260 RepID=UPI00247FF3BD|nr:hypothetical protein [Flavobacterium gelatinilyticum]
MKIPYFFILIALTVISCQKDQKKAQTEIVTISEIPEVTETEEQTTDEKVLHTDTIILSEDKNADINLVLANLVKQEADKDSVVTSTFRLDFYQNKNKIASSKIAIQQYEKGSDWSGSLGLTESSNQNSSFISIGSGYPACGYTHENYLYYLKDSNLQLVHHWQSMSDSGWGMWTEFVNHDSEGGKDPKMFYCKTVAFVPGDDDNEDSGILKYSDSISFSLQGSHWKKKLLSAKEKPYFEKKMTFNEFHNQQ